MFLFFVIVGGRTYIGGWLHHSWQSYTELEFDKPSSARTACTARVADRHTKITHEEPRQSTPP